MRGRRAQDARHSTTGSGERHLHAPGRPSPVVWRLAIVITSLIVFGAGSLLHHGSIPPTWAVTEESESDHEYRLALPGYHYRFPRDHGSHDEYRTEWWYYTGHLRADDGRRFGYELTFFRRAVQPGPRKAGSSRWTIHHLYFAHFALTDVDAGRFRFAEKLSRAALGKAGAESGRLHVWIDRWFARMEPGDAATHHLHAETQAIALDLVLSPTKPPVVHGSDGVSRKGDQRGQASHYYSFTRLATQGAVRVGDRRFTVTGQSWMDHEFGSTDLGEDQLGWDWFSVQLEDQTELMLYLLRRRDGTPDPASSGTFVFPDGRTRHLTSGEIRVAVLDHWQSDASGARYPSRWRVTVPVLALSLDLTPLLPDQELRTDKSTQVTYWEGAVTAEGTRSDAALTGQGYVELTGYAPQRESTL